MSQALYIVLAYVTDLVPLTVGADVDPERLLRPDTATMRKERMAMKATAAMTIAKTCQLEKIDPDLEQLQSPALERRTEK